jgi:hypothetical protein
MDDAGIINLRKGVDWLNAAAGNLLVDGPLFARVGGTLLAKIRGDMSNDVELTEAILSALREWLALSVPHSGTQLDRLKGEIVRHMTIAATREDATRDAEKIMRAANYLLKCDPDLIRLLPDLPKPPPDNVTNLR